MEVAAAAASSSPPLLLSSPRRRCLPVLPSPSSSSPLGHRPTRPRKSLLCLAAAPSLLPHSKSGGGGRLRCSASSSSGAPRASSSLVRWVLEPAGDGDWRHIGYKVARPGAIEIASDAVTVGRVADKADVVLPVATVSSMHARLENKEGRLLVTDLESTNGTYINERRLVPGFAIPIDPGSLLIFGDIHLAMFRVWKTVVEEEAPAPEESEEAQEQATEAAVAASTAAAAAGGEGDAATS